MKIVFRFTLALLLLSNLSYGTTIRVSKSLYPVKVDGVFDEVCWDNADVARNFQMNFPFDTLGASSKTEVKITYSDEYLYISATCFDDTGSDYVIQSLKRDFDFYENDAFIVLIDAFSDKTSGYSFAVTPYGVQRDALIYEGGIAGDDDTWNALWQSSVKRESDRWTIEMAIPFKSLRYKKGIDEWRINFARNDQKKNELSSWVAVPREFKITRMESAGQLKWDSAPKPSGSKVVLIPYLANIRDQDLEATSTAVNNVPNMGVDVKVGINSSMNLDITINPDFSQVDVDEQIINLSRFEPSFPERRFFFLENSDLFAELGNSRVRPFFSRRLGLSEENEAVSILGGAKLSGKLNQDLRVGLMTVQTEEKGDEQGHNYTLGVLEKKVLGASSLRFFMSNAQDLEDGKFQSNSYNRVGGAELDFRSKKTKITGHTYLHYSTNQDELKNNIAYGAKARYRDKYYNFFLGIDAVGSNYISDFGYVPHLSHEYDDNSYIIGYSQYRTNGSYRFYFNENKIFDYFAPIYRANLFTGNGGNYQEHDYSLGFDVSFKDQSFIEVEYQISNPKIYYDGEFTLSGLETPFDAGNYKQRTFSFEGNTSKTNRVFGLASFSYGDKYNGKLTQMEYELKYRTKNPFLTLGISYTSKKLHDFPTEFGNAHFHLIGNTTELSFNKNLFWTTFMQYNTQKDNFNVNSRLQWRYNSLSDFFLVYSSNYFSDDFDRKNWALVLKLNYWFNL